MIERRFTRRDFLQSATAGAAVFLLAGCSGDDDDDEASAPTATAGAVPTATTAPAPTATVAVVASPTPSAVPATATPEAAAEWTYTDFLGRVITLPEPPQSIAAEIGAAAALYDMGIQVTSVWGYPANDPEGYEEAWGRLPVDSVENISNADGDVDPEKAVLHGTDLFILGSTELSDATSYGGHDGYIDVLKPIAPIAAWPFLERLDLTMEGIWDLALALGADPESATNVAARAAYDGAIAELQGLLEERQGLTSFFGYPVDTELYIANPDLWDDVNFFRYLGLEVVDLGEELRGEWWEILSWEEALKYQTDTVFLANVSGALTLDELREHPTFGRHPALLAGQVGVWSWYFARSPQGISALIENVTAVIRTAEKVTE